eukprot:1483193-Pyramimonas_sp.AAC.1
MHGWIAARFQNVALAPALRAFVLTNCKEYTIGGRPAFKMWLSPHSSEEFATISKAIMVNVPECASWRDAGMSGRKRHFDPQR